MNREQPTIRLPEELKEKLQRKMGRIPKLGERDVYMDNDSPSVIITGNNKGIAR